MARHSTHCPPRAHHFDVTSATTWWCCAQVLLQLDARIIVMNGLAAGYAGSSSIQHGRFGDGCTLQLDLVHSECGHGVNGAVYNMFHGSGGKGAGQSRNTSRPKKHNDTYSPAAHRAANKRRAKAAAAARWAAVSQGDQASSAR